ncbi:MAG: DedA family protein [Candidatus Bathyarchaeia archaeon]
MSHQSLERLRRKAPQLIVAAFAIIVVVYFVLDFLEDVVIEGGPITSEPIISIIISITRGVTAAVQSWGYSGIFGLMLLESSSLPIPSEVILPFAGYLVSMGQINFWITLTIATIAGLLGSLLDYYIGLKGVQSLTQHKILGKVILSTNQLEVAEKWFIKHGSLMVFISRIIPGFRTTFSFPAGAAKMKLSKFIAFTTAGCLLWNIILIYLGWYLGKNWTQVAGVSRYLILAAVAAVVIVILVYLIRRKQKNTRTKRDK